jgi:GNAT superfamily N-acetyltransferase
MSILSLNIPAYFAESELDDLNHYLDHKIEDYFVAVYNDAIIGAGGINYKNEKTTGVISWDFLTPAFHGKGFGRELLKHRLNLLKADTQISQILVRTSQMSFSFYEKCGFELIEIQKDYWSEGYDLYSMEFNIH